jgi:lysine 6-dehydrogenase
LKIFRYPGTFAQLKAFSDLGLFELDPIAVHGNPVIPRHVFHALYEPKVTAPVIDDICINRAQVVGLKNGRKTNAIVELIDYYDSATGFTSMQRTTGWHLSIVAALMAQKRTPVGSIPLEVAVGGDDFVCEARKRGFKITESVTPA